MFAFNLSASVNILRALASPSLLVPHATVPSFAQLAPPLIPGADIRAVVLDKDNCFAAPHGARVLPECAAAFAALRAAYPGARLLIVSNSAGTRDDAGGAQAAALEAATGVAVLRHATKKPGCHPEVLAWLRARAGVERPDQVAVVGDRLATDVLMAAMMGSYSVWVRDGTSARPAHATMVSARADARAQRLTRAVWARRARRAGVAARARRRARAAVASPALRRARTRAGRRGRRDRHGQWAGGWLCLWRLRRRLPRRARSARGWAPRHGFGRRRGCQGAACCPQRDSVYSQEQASLSAIPPCESGVE